MKTSLIPLPDARVQLLLQRLCEIYRRNFSTAASSGSMLAQLGLADFNAVERYGLGYSDGELPKILPGDPVFRSELTRLGVLTPKGADRLTQRTIFPVFGPDGRYLNLWAMSATERSRFLLGRPVGLWNLSAGRHAATLYVTENPFEALSLIAAGFTNTAALDPISGEPDLAALQAFGVQRLHIVVGNTRQGQAACDQLRAKFTGWIVSMIVLPGCATVNEFLRRKGPKGLAEALVAATHGLPAVNVPGMQPLSGGFSLKIENRLYEVRALHKSGNQLKATFRLERGEKWHVDTFDLNLARARKEFVREVVRIFEESADLIESDLGKLLTACEVRAAQPDLTLPTENFDPVPEADRKEAEAMGRDPKLVSIILEDFERMGVVGEPLNKLLCYLAMTSRKQKQPLSVMFVSSSGAGKNTIADAARDMCPPEERVEATNLSGKALYYMGAQALKHKLLAVDEREGARHADYSLRILISAGKLTTKVATRDPTSGKLRTDTNVVEGPVAVLITTSDPNTNAETKSRFVVSSIDESPEQTRAIQDYQRKQYTLEGLSADNARQAVLRRHHALQRILHSVHVVNPAPERVGEVGDRLSSRRDLPKIHRLVQAIAFLRQLQKPVKQHDGLNYIDVDDVDLQIAAPIIKKLFGSLLRELSHPSQELLRQLVEMRAGARQTVGSPEPWTFTRRQAREFTGLPNTTLHRYLTELLEFEYVLREQGARRSQHRYLLDWEPPTQPIPAPGPSADHPNYSTTVPRPFQPASSVANGRASGR